MCERPADPEERASCPLCREEATLGALEAHVASHLEDLALFVLPREADDDDTDADSNNAKKPTEKDCHDDEETSTRGTFSDLVSSSKV